MFREVKIEKIICKDTENPLVIVLCPNYEERSIYVSKRLSELINKAKRPIDYEIFSLRNNKNNNILLEGLKNKYFEILCKNLDILQQEYGHWIQYPNNFSANALKSILNDRFNSYSNNKKKICIDFLFDISAMPRFMIFTLCEAFQSLIDTHKGMIGNVMFAYVTPQQYSTVHYAQDIGIINGFFSGRTLRSNQPKAVHSIIFPSRSGHEGKLLLDDLSLIPFEQRHTVFFPINTKYFLHSLELMRANQMLLDRESYSHQFYCSISDAVIDLHSYITNEIEELLKTTDKIQKKSIKQLYLVAPFGEKIFLPISYFELQKMKKTPGVKDIVEIDICHAKGFQYTSVYSLGIGTMSIFEMEVRDYEN